VRSVTVLPQPASPKKVGSARSGASGSPRPKALALHVDEDTTILGESSIARPHHPHFHGPALFGKRGEHVGHGRRDSLRCLYVPRRLRDW
jgi:hypothetical protein